MAAGERSEAPARVDAMDELDALVAVGARGPGTDAERRAARHLAGRLEALGRTARVESLFTWPRWPGGLTLLLLLGAGAGVRVRVRPRGRRCAGARGARGLSARRRRGAAAGAPAPRPPRVPERGLATGRRPARARSSWWRTWTPAARASSTGPPPQPPAPPAPLQRPLSRCSSRPCSPAAIVRLAGVDAAALTAVQFALAVALIVAVALRGRHLALPHRARRLRQRLGRRARPPAGRAARRQARALRPARAASRARRRPAGPTACARSCAATGASCRATAPCSSTSTRSASGSPCYTRARGPAPRRALARPAHRALRGDRRRRTGRRSTVRAASDGFAARYAGYPAITVTCRDEHGRAPRHHRRSDLPEHVEPESLAAAEELCVELAERLDATVGPDLRED